MYLRRLGTKIYLMYMRTSSKFSSAYISTLVLDHVSQTTQFLKKLPLIGTKVSLISGQLGSGRVGFSRARVGPGRIALSYDDVGSGRVGLSYDRVGSG